jgi:nucleoid DNA-binding protein
LTKTELIERAAEKWNGCGLGIGKLGKKALISEVLECILDEVEDAARDKVEVKIEGFGTLKPTFRKRRSRHNIQTGETDIHEAHYVLRFRPSKRLRDALKE